MPLGRPHPDASTPQRSRRKRPLPPSGSATTSNKRVSFDNGVRGPSPAYSRPKTRAPEIHEIHNTVNSGDDEGTEGGTEDEISNQVNADLISSTKGPIEHVYEKIRERSRPVTEAYEQQEAFLLLKNTQKAIWTMSEPEQEAEQDEEVCRRVHKLRAQIIDFAHAYVRDVNKSKRRLSVEYLCSNVDNAKLVHYIGYLAQGGANAIVSWDQLLNNAECLTALIVGIVGSALKEHVFSALWFGGSDEEIAILEDYQEKEKDDDGYKRTKTRAETCKGFDPYSDSSNYTRDVACIAIALRKLLTPLLHMSKSPGLLPQMSDELCDDLFEIVTDAGQLSREMRLCEDVIYHWSLTFKDEEFDPERMECLNHASMIHNSPYEIRQQRSVLKGATEKSQAIVRVTAFPGVVAHRKGGGLLAKTLLDEEKREEKASKAYLPPDVQRSREIGAGKPLSGEEGFRTRVICKSIVHLEWGTQRLLTKEAGTSRHLDAMRDGGTAKYEEDRRGFVELFDVFLEKHPDLLESLEDA